MMMALQEVILVAEVLRKVIFRATREASAEMISQEEALYDEGLHI